MSPTTFTAPAVVRAPDVHDPTHDAVLAVPAGVSVAVIGAPGTGKTTMLARLVAERVRTDGITSDGFGSVVALTSSRASATALRDRLAATVGRVTPGALARTVNSLAFEIVTAAARAASAPPPTLLTGGEQDAVLADLLRGHDEDGTGPDWPEPITPSVRERAGFRTALRDVMMRASAAGVEPDAMRAAAGAAGRPEWAAVADVVDDYRAAVLSYRPSGLDAAELVAFATAAVERGQVPPSIAAIRTVVVDDAQELVEGEIALLGALARSGVQVVAFGDPDIAASAFRGAEPDVLGRLGVRLGVPTAPAVVLGTVHRHPAAIRDLVRTITERIGTAAAGTQRAAVAGGGAGAGADGADGADGGAGAGAGARVDADPDAVGAGAPGADPSGDAVVRIEAPSPHALVAAVARRLREHHLLGGVPWHRMVVVTRSGASIPDIVRSLSVAEVPASAGAAPVRARDDLAARALIDAAAVALGVLPLDAVVASTLVAGPLAGLDALALRRLRLALRREEIDGGGVRGADALLVEALAAPGRFVTIDAAFARRAGRFADSLETARSDARTGATIEELLWGLWERSGLARTWGEQSAAGGVGAAEADRHLDAVVGLFAAAKRYVERDPSAPARGFVDDVLGADLPEDTIGPDRTAGRVRVSTPTATIGVECDVVVVLGLQDGVWPNTRIRGSLLDPDGLLRTASGAAGASPSPVDDRAAVMSDELRLFARAVSRARTHVIIGSVANDDEAPSPFLRLVPQEPDTSAPAHPLSLRGMAGALRRSVLTEHSTEAAAALARLAAEGVPGAAPDDWYGIARPTTTRPLVDLTEDGATVSVSPSGIGTYEECPLHWFVQRFGGGSPSPAMGIGTIVHDVMEHAVAVDVDSLWGRVEERWPELTFESEWVADRERRRTRTMIEGLSDYLRAFQAAGRRVLGAEASFELVSGPARVRGSIDRIEADADGRVSVVDLKTGSTVPSKATMAEHPQLAAYQLALSDERVDGVPPASAVTDARLVFVAKPVRGQAYTERVQHAFDDQARDGFRIRLGDVARGMGGAVFVGHVDAHCSDAYRGGDCRIHIAPEVTW